MADRAALRGGALVPAGIAAAVLALAVVGAGTRGPWSAGSNEVDVPVGDSTPPPAMPTAESATLEAGESTAPVQEAPFEVPTWVTDVVVVLAVALALALVVLAVRWLLARRAGRRSETFEHKAPGATAAEPALEVVGDLEPALHRAARALREGDQPGDGIVAAWVTLEEEAAASGAAREVAQTPTEFTTALLRRTHADHDAVAALRARYLAARFGDHPPTDDDVEAVSAALDRIQATWAGR